jgi:23S rRNA maturation-related 3'-5' exoribonuclease YhaM
MYLIYFFFLAAVDSFVGNKIEYRQNKMLVIIKIAIINEKLNDLRLSRNELCK